ncbi:hypothetical protein CYY_005108 [Polysphondylium violaceum]|uniref:PH domain-containing protein n=1 Tax=Polysphondylium violaceum TaxID=133409 RepID=A0A8J4USG3_9MYCE|nr:hypothetical protein CYY_005108 [Polysphondylium violaceum]
MDNNSNNNIEGENSNSTNNENNNVVSNNLTDNNSNSSRSSSDSSLKEDKEKINSMSESSSTLTFESRACSTSSLTSMISSISSHSSIMSNSSSSIFVASSSSSPTTPTKRKLIEGELVKQGHIFKSWRTRWFKIEDGYLCYYKSKEEAEPIDKVPLRGARVSKKPFHDRPNTFELIATTMRKIFLLQGKDTQDVDFWMTELTKEIEYARSLYSKTQQTRI